VAGKKTTPSKKPGKAKLRQGKPLQTVQPLTVISGMAGESLDRGHKP
jgi:hypothetical protein